jgi:hypothetical protein
MHRDVHVFGSSVDTIGEEYDHFCCYGYCIALLQELSKNLSFVFTLHLVADNKYGSYEKVMSNHSSLAVRGNDKCRLH